MKGILHPKKNSANEISISSFSKGVILSIYLLVKSLSFFLIFLGGDLKMDAIFARELVDKALSAAADVEGEQA